MNSRRLIDGLRGWRQGTEPAQTSTLEGAGREGPLSESQ